MMKATAVANSNIALVKYWGKRDEKLILPWNSNISVALDGLFTKTTVEFDRALPKDMFILGGVEQEGEEAQRVLETLDLIRQMSGSNLKAKVQSLNSFPTAAGLASSASGAAALVLAASAAAGLKLSKKELSILARRNSGSGSRSVEGGFVEWIKGEKADGSDSYGKQLFDEKHWPEFRILTTIVTSKAKPIKSRAGMKQSVATSPLYKGWLESVEADLQAVREGIKKKDVTKVGEAAEHNALKMHAVMMSTKPAIIYWLPETIAVMSAVKGLRESGKKCWFTMDAGPQVKVVCLESEAQAIKGALEKVPGVSSVGTHAPGRGAKLTEEHVF